MFLYFLKAVQSFLIKICADVFWCYTGGYCTKSLFQSPHALLCWVTFWCILVYFGLHMYSWWYSDGPQTTKLCGIVALCWDYCKIFLGVILAFFLYFLRIVQHIFKRWMESGWYRWDRGYGWGGGGELDEVVDMDWGEGSWYGWVWRYGIFLNRRGRFRNRKVLYLCHFTIPYTIFLSICVELAIRRTNAFWELIFVKGLP